MSVDHRSELPAHILSGAQLDELELLIGGLYAPAHGYCLPSAVPKNWPAAVTLTIPVHLGEQACAESALLLCDPDGTQLALLEVSDSEYESESRIYLAGKLSPLRPAEHPPLRQLRVTSPLPLASRWGRQTVVSAFASPPSAAQIAMVLSTAARRNADVCFLAVAGPQEHGRYTVLTLMSVLEECAAQVPGATARLLVLAASPRSADRRDQLVHDQVLNNLGAVMLLDFTAAGGMPATAAPTSCAHQGRGAVIFLTGLSGSGKSTLARALAERLQQTAERTVTLLDGDDVRRLLSSELGFTREDRETNVRRLGWVASLIAAAGGNAVCAPIAPFDATRQEVRAMAGDGPFLLVHVSTSLQVCEARDRKGLYARARAGHIPDFTGISSPYEIPMDADLVIDTAQMNVNSAVFSIMNALSSQSARVAKPMTL